MPNLCTKGPKAHADRMAPTRAASSRACSGAAKQALKTLWPKPLLVLPDQQDWLRFYCHSILGGMGIELNLPEFGHKKKKTLANDQGILQDNESLRHVCLGSLLCQGAKVWDESQGLNHHFQLRSRQAFHCCW